MAAAVQSAPSLETLSDNINKVKVLKTDITHNKDLYGEPESNKAKDKVVFHQFNDACD